ncbi:MAG: phosphate acetyltransferase [Bacilli bacterium]|nr:phosphate acetyltransferase [Bacilli bacterium]
MNIIENIKKRAKENKKTIVLPETEDLRTIKAAALVKEEDFANIILVGDEIKINEMASENNLDINGIKIINPNNSVLTEELISKFYELRKEKGMTLDKSREIITNNYIYFGDMLVKMDYADGLVAGAVNSSAVVLRAALQILKTSKDSKIVSSFFLMDVPNCEYGANGVFLYSDCGMIQNPTSEELVEIAASSAKSFKKLVNVDPVIAMLSHSTMGSSKHPDVDKVVEAVKLAHETYPELVLDGDLQADAAIVPSVAKSKAPNSNVAGNANVLIFPDLDAGNIAYKLTERLAKAKAYGPVTQGIAKPVNDLSRGCNEHDIVGVVAITCVQCD